MNRHLSRSGDRETSKLAAASLDIDLSQKHRVALGIAEQMCPATDLEMALEMSRRGLGREESCRRLVRTLREEHGRLIPALDANGQQLRHLNPTGRWAECWIPGYGTPMERPVEDTVAARVGRCQQVDVDGVEHVRFDGRQFYLAADLIDALTMPDDESNESNDESNDVEPEVGQISML